MAAQYNNNNNSTMMLVVDNNNSMTNNSMMNINMMYKYSIPPTSPPIILNDTTTTTTTTTTTATSNRLHVIAKRKFEKLKNKIAEFFFTSNTNTTLSNNNNNNNNSSKNSIVLNTNNNSNSTNHNNGTRSGSGGSVRTRNNHKTNSIKKQSQSNNTFSNCYYGYKSDNDNNCNINTNNNNNNNYASSVTYPPNSLFNVQTQSYFSTISPFNIDDEEFQANLFDKNFMIDYITYTIISQIKQSDLVRFLHLDFQLPKANNGTNLVKDIANHIYSIAEEEPCGLKGCKMSIELNLKDSLNKEIEKLEQFNQQQQRKQQNNDSRSSTLQSQKSFQQQQQQQQRQNVYELTRFRFDVSNSLTTFELKLCLKEEEKFTLTARNVCLLLPKNKVNFIDKMTTQSPIQLDPTYNLVKRKLY